MDMRNSKFGHTFGNILQPPPAISRACRESRHVATRCGGMVYFGGWNSTHLTWFQMDRDFLVWTPGCELGDLAPIVKRVLVPCQYAYKFFDGDEFEEIIFPRDCYFSNCTNVEEIYIEIGCHSRFVDDSWHPGLVTEIFQHDAIVVPQNDDPDSSSVTRIDSILSRYDIAQLLPPKVYRYWQKMHLGNDEDVMRSNDWKVLGEEIRDNWAADFSGKKGYVPHSPNWDMDWIVSQDYGQQYRWMRDRARRVFVSETELKVYPTSAFIRLEGIPASAVQRDAQEYPGRL